MAVIPRVLIVALSLPKIACLGWVETTRLIAGLPAEISILLKVSVLVWFESASQALPVVAVIETVVKARGNLVTVAEWLSVRVSGNRCTRRWRLVKTGAVFSEGCAHRDSGLGEHRTSSQDHHRQQFRFHKVSSFLPLSVQGNGRKLSANGCGK
jgi:hypothetical protein